MIDSLLSTRVTSLQPSGIRKFFDLVSQRQGVISLGVGEPDFLTPWHIRDEAIFALEKGRTTYTSNSGILELRQEIARYLHNRYQLDYDATEAILVTVGASEAIDLVVRSVVEPGEEVLVPEPSYVSYAPCVHLVGGVPIAVPTTEKTEFRVAPADIEDCLSPKTKMMILPYPNNPTGAIMERSDLDEIAMVLRQRNILVVSDEIYSELTYGSDHVSIASLPGMFERTLVINGFSKSFAMTGWRLGYAAGPAGLIQAMTRIHQYSIMCTPTVSQYAALVALKDGMADVKAMREEYDRRRKLMVHGFRKMGLACFEPKGAFYVFPCIRSLGMTSEEFCDQLLHEQNVAVVPGTAFGACGQGYVRCSYAYSLKSLQEALVRIEAFVAKHRK